MTLATLTRPYDELTPENVVFLFIDQQLVPLWDLEFAELRRNVFRLAQSATSFGVPTVVTTIATEQWGPVIPELMVAAPESTFVERSTVNAWDDSGVRRAVERGGSTGRRTKLVISGSITEIGVAMCAIAAARAGYEVYAVLDASGQSTHRALLGMLDAGVIVTTTALVVREMTRTAVPQVGYDVLSQRDVA